MRHPMTRATAGRLAAVTAALFGVSTAVAAPPATVTSGADSGPGTLREALASGATTIFVGGQVSIIDIASTLTYGGTEPLQLLGRGQIIRADRTGGDFTLFEVSNGANLSITNLRFDGGGGFSFDNQGDGKGIFVQVPTDRTGVVNVELSKVEVTGVANHGIHVSDCTLGDDCGAGSGGGGDGSPASIRLSLDNVTVRGAGTGRFDGDGVRVDERADGSILFEGYAIDLSGNGADGLELDEGNDGDVIVNVRNAFFEDNGFYCLPAPLDLAEPCVEDDDGELVLDLDDGFDIDQAGAGALQGTIINAVVTGNLDEGLDFDSEEGGNVTFDLRRITGMFNGDEAVKVSVEAGGDIFVDMRNMDIGANGNDGIQIENEDGDGETHVIFRNSISTGNDDDGLKLSQENAVELGTLQLRGFTEVDSIDLENVVQR